MINTHNNHVIGINYGSVTVTCWCPATCDVVDPWPTTPTPEPVLGGRTDTDRIVSIPRCLQAQRCLHLLSNNPSMTTVPRCASSRVFGNLDHLKALIVRHWTFIYCSFWLTYITMLSFIPLSCYRFEGLIYYNAIIMKNYINYNVPNVEFNLTHS